MKLDLHTHTTFSDGTLEPEDLVRMAKQAGITHLAISDHDSVGGILEAQKKMKDAELTLIPAVEINTREVSFVHILGYFIDEKSEPFLKILADHRQMRMVRARSILEKLQKMGIKISMDDFNNDRKHAAIGRPHIADKLKEKGLVFSRQEAFEKYLSQGKSAHVSYDGPAPEDAIGAILAAKGIPVVAHPGYYVSKEMIESLTKIGLQGIETYYPRHSPLQVKKFEELAEKFDLVTTGGSDYHGPGSGHEGLGEVPVPEEVLAKLLERKKKLFG